MLCDSGECRRGIEGFERGKEALRTHGPGTIGWKQRADSART